MKSSVPFLATVLFFLPILAFADHSVNINTAGLEELDLLPGVGPTIAQRIIDGRPYASVEEVSRVNGIGDPGSKSYEDIITHITISGGSSTAPQDTAQTSSGSETSTQTTDSAAKKTTSSYVSLPGSELFVDAGGDRIVIAGADADFKARAYDEGKEVVSNAHFSWNFGDGSTATGRIALHSFVYPGRYAVVLSASDNEDTASDRITVTAVSAELIFSLLSDGGVAIENYGSFDLDLSRWIIYSSGGQFALPDGSIVLAGETLRIPQKTLSFSTGADTALYYPNGTFAFGAGEPVPITKSAPVSTSPTQSVQTVQTTDDTDDETETAIVNDDKTEEGDAVTSGEPTTSPHVAAAGAAGSWKWWMGALVVALAGAGSIYITRRYAKREWNIVEE